MSSFGYSKLTKKGKLSDKGSLGYLRDPMYFNKVNYTYMKGTKQKDITAKESEKIATELSKKYDKAISMKFYMIDSKSIKKIKNGNFSYKGQKSYRYKTEQY